MTMVRHKKGNCCQNAQCPVALLHCSPIYIELTSSYHYLFFCADHLREKWTYTVDCMHIYFDQWGVVDLIDHHHHHLSRSCHCWQMASTTCAMHFDPGPFSSIDCQRLPRCHLSISFWVFLLVVFHLWVSTLMLFSPTWCSSFWLHVLPTVLSCTSLFLLYLSPLFLILLSRS